MITRAQHDSATREYLARKQAEGKTRKGALRSLKRYLARRFWRLLTEPPLEPQQAPERTTPPAERTAEPAEQTTPPAERTAEPAEPEPITIPQPSAARREVQRIAAAIPMVCIT